MTGFVTVEEPHTTMMASEAVAAHVVTFLQTGSLADK